MRRLSLDTVTFISTVCMISVFSYYPVFQAIAYSRYIVIFLWMLLCLSSLKRVIRVCGEFKTILILYLMFMLSSVINFLVLQSTAVFSNHFFVPITVAIMIFAAAYMSSNKINMRGIMRICRSYMYAAMLASVFLFFFYLRGTDIYSIIYQYSYGKNEIAVILMCAIIIACTIYIPQNKLQHIIRIAGIGFMVIDILLMKCRSVLFGLAFLIIILVFINTKELKVIRRLVFAALVVFVAVVISNEALREIFVNQFLFANRESNSIDAISSGRLTQISQGLKVFSENFMVGVGYRHTLDCCYISLLANYGVLAWPSILLALYPVKWGFSRIMRKKDPLTICYFVIAVGMFFVSLLEELAPFGPGTRGFVLWLMWGLMAGQTTQNGKEAQYDTY